MKQQSLTQPWKVHRRTIRLDGYDHRVLSLRPHDRVRFATNQFHDTWHIVSDSHGGQLMGRLCWALAYQKQPGTFILIDQPNIVPTPFEADPSSPILIANTDLGRPSRQAVRQLKAMLPFATRSEGTVKLATFGLDAALSEATDNWQWSDGWKSDRRASAAKVNGIVMLAGRGAVLKSWGRALARIGRGMHLGTDYEYLAGGDGEVQIFRDFRLMVRLSGELRDVEFPGRGHEELKPTERDRIYALRDEREKRLRAEWAKRAG